MKRVVVFGASGFVGAMLVERLLQAGNCEVVPVVHSSGNAWRVARLPLSVRTVDLLAPAGISAVLEGASHVVNCTRGDDKVMLQGFKSLLQACSAKLVSRFVHLSSVAVYGDPPPPESRIESGPTNPARGGYGWIKLKQDEMLQDAARAGLASVSLCPPNIGGPYSLFHMALLGGLRRGRIPLVDDGAGPCNLVDVDNLVQAIELALDGGPNDGRRLFITDEGTPTWAEVLAELRPLLPTTAPPVPNVSAIELKALLEAQRPPSPSLSRTVKHLISGDVRAVLRRDPLLARVDAALRSAVTVLGAAAEDRIRLSIDAQARGKSPGNSQAIDLRLASQQLRNVVHSSALATEMLGYRPRRDFAQSMEAFRNWYSSGTGADSPFADLYARVPT